MLHTSTVEFRTLGLLKSLSYFEDAEEDEEPVFLQQADWKTIRKTIDKEVNSLLM